MKKNHLRNFSYVITSLFLSSYWLLSTYAKFLGFLATHKVSVLLMTICQGVVGVLFFIRKSPKSVSGNVFETIIAFAGTFAILFYRPSAGAETLIGEIIVIIGALVLLYSLLSLNTSFGIIPANRGIKTHGMYHLVRHPIYMSYIIFYMAYCINNPTLYNGIVLISAFLLD